MLRNTIVRARQCAATGARVQRRKLSSEAAAPHFETTPASVPRANWGKGGFSAPEQIVFNKQQMKCSEHLCEPECECCSSARVPASSACCPRLNHFFCCCAKGVADDVAPALSLSSCLPPFALASSRACYFGTDPSPARTHRASAHPY
jgi:hypothetical protein